MELVWTVIALLLRWGHVLPAAMLVGGAIYARLAVVPTLEEVPDEQRSQLQDELARRWSMMVGICAGLLLLSGFVNAGMNINQFYFEPPGLYHSLILVKLLLALAVLYIASLLTGSSENAKEFRKSGKFWLTINCWLAVLLVLVGGGMKLCDRKERSLDKPPPATAPGETAKPAT